MTSKAFLKCHEVTAKWEGGWSNHPDDPGGATMYGVIQKVYDAWRRTKGRVTQTVRKITKSEALEIFYQNYWLVCGADRLVAGVDLAVYDAAVNSGPGRARKWLLASIGSSDDADTVKRICQRRLAFVQGLSTFKTFGRGWSRRIADIQAKGVAWAVEAMHGTAAVSERLREEAADKKGAASANGKASAGTGVVTGAGSSVTVPGAAQGDGSMLWLILALACIGVVITAILIIRARRSGDQAEAFEREAEVFSRA